MILAALGFIGIGGLHRFNIALKAKDEQQAFLGGIFLLPLVLFVLLVVLGGDFRLWYVAPFLIAWGLTIFDLINMDRLLSGELSAKKAWYETWPGRIGAIILLPIALYFLYTKTDIPQKQKNAIAGVLVGGLALFLGASFTGIEELTGELNGDQTPDSSQEAGSGTTPANEAGLYETCDEVRAAGIETPIEADSDLYAAWLDRDKDGLACE